VADRLDIQALMPLCATLGMRTESATKDLVALSLDWRADLCTTGGLLHGGALMALADSTGGYCAFLNLPEDHVTTTIESKTNLLRAVREGSVTATSRPLHAGRTVVVVETELRDDRDRLVAKTTQTQAVLPAG
jgi:1,4-dihydroxy-2-naphthoyl-CoA hydrolase